jgi:hypothetical protein
MKKMKLLAALGVLAWPLAGLAQAPGGAVPMPSRSEPTEDLRTRNALSQAEIKRLAEQIDQWDRAEGAGAMTPREAKLRAAAMLGVLKVSCTVSEAMYRGSADNDPGQRIYEAACEDGMGYLLLLQRTTLRGVSCLAAGPDGPPVKCAMPMNADSRAMAGRVLSRHQIDCRVRDLKWLGTSAADLDHVEIACENGNGYMMRSPRIGSSGKLEIMGCLEAIKQGLACELSSQAGAAAGRTADSRPSLEWFKEALSRNGVSCLTKRGRIIGRESIKRRYLVEFECTDRPEGLIAFVPPVGDTANAFESMSCVAAAQRGIRCEWVSGVGQAGVALPPH